VRRALFLLCALALAACDGPTDPRDAALAGRWLYRASVGGCEVTGVLRVTQRGSVLEGRLAWPGGPCDSSTAPRVPTDSAVTLTGRVDGDGATFTLRGWGSELTHTATVRADSMAGAVSGAPWGPTTVEGGTFHARRYGDGEVLPERFRVAVDGAVADTLEGSAHANRWELVMTRDDGRARLTIAVLPLEGRIPMSPGTYPVHDWTVNPDSLAGGLVYFGDGTRVFRAREGTVTITSASDGALRGTVDLTAYRPNAPQTTVHVRGAFNALFTSGSAF
jgi:hypothetical protein